MKNVANMFKAMGDEVRLDIVRMLAGKELCVCDIMDAFDKSQPTISHHLKVLKYAGIVDDARDGKWIYYSLKPEAFHLIETFLGGIGTELTKKVRIKQCD